MTTSNHSEMDLGNNSLYMHMDAKPTYFKSILRRFISKTRETPKNRIKKCTHGQMHNSIRSTSSTMNGIHTLVTMDDKHPSSCEAFFIINSIRDLDVSQRLEILKSPSQLNRKCK